MRAELTGQTSKTLNYIDHPFVGPYFGLFVAVWIYLRHYLNLRILLSEFYEFRTVGPFGVVWETEQYKGTLSNVISTLLIGCLQALNLFWLWAILRIAYRFLFLNALSDVRSDDDEAEYEVEVVEDAAHERGEREEISRLEPQVAKKGPEITLNGAKVEGEAPRQSKAKKRGKKA